MNLVKPRSAFNGHWHFAAYEGEVEKARLWTPDDGSALPVGSLYQEVPSSPPVWEYEDDNLIVTVGKNLTLDRLFALSGPPAAIGHVGVGTDNAAAVVGQLQLNPVTAGSVLIQVADGGTARSSQTVTIKSTFGTGVANFIWAETGAFNGTVNGTAIMLNRIVIGPFTKTSAVSIIVTLTFTQA